MGSYRNPESSPGRPVEQPSPAQYQSQPGATPWNGLFAAGCEAGHDKGDDRQDQALARGEGQGHLGLQDAAGRLRAEGVKGINFLTTLYCTDEVSLPVAFALVEKDEAFTDEKTGKPKRRASVSKNEHYCIKQGDAPGLRQEPDAVPLRPHPNKASTTCGSRRQTT